MLDPLLDSVSLNGSVKSIIFSTFFECLVLKWVINVHE